MENPITNCSDCPLRDRCQSPCPTVERQLPKEWQGRVEGLHRYNARASARRLAEQVRLTRIILDHRDVLGGRLRQVVNMTYDDGLSHAAIARKIGVTRRVVGTYLARAHRLIGKVAVGMRVREREK